ncbi:MAG: transketolase [Acidimicrobiales bacterium]|nr:transketolase [Acidimicrobiales bacterium]
MSTAAGGREPGRDLARAIRATVVEQSWRAGVGHIGSALCVADLLAALYGEVLVDHDPADPDRDRVVVSKGHAALAVYAALHARGWLDDDELDTFCGDGTLLGVHPDAGLPGVDFTTGSLGQGLSYAAGSVLAARLQRSARRAFALVSDAECDEGALWEAAMFAAHHRLGRLVALVDVNGQQALGATADVVSLEPLADRWASFGWEVHEVDGHDVAALARTAGAPADERDRPRVVLARTTFGKGVSFMEGRLGWHYWPLDAGQYEQARAEVAAG